MSRLTGSRRERTANVGNDTTMAQMLFKYKAQGRLLSYEKFTSKYTSLPIKSSLAIHQGREAGILLSSTHIYYHTFEDGKPNISKV